MDAIIAEAAREPDVYLISNTARNSVGWSWHINRGPARVRLPHAIDDRPIVQTPDARPQEESRQGRMIVIDGERNIASLVVVDRVPEDQILHDGICRYDGLVRRAPHAYSQIERPACLCKYLAHAEE
jgi:hypothetical protein